VLTITTKRTPAAGYVEVAFGDTGPGITEEQKGRLFEPFYTTKPPGQGTGLGLSICKRIVESFGGGIHVESQVGQGATFTVSLPVLQKEEE
jgi:signal transduction histidine kinase